MRFAIFLLACGLLVFELFATSILGIVVGPQAAYYSIATAMLGLGAASTLISLIPYETLKKYERGALVYTTFLIGPAVILFLLYSTHLKELVNAERLEALRISESNAWLLMEEHEFGLSLKVGAGLCLTYLLHGIALSTLFRLNAQRSTVLYAFDLFGAALGCFIFVQTLEYFGFAATATLSAVAPMAAAALFAKGIGQKKLSWGLIAATPVLAVLMNLPAVTPKLEPQPLMELLTRDHQLKFDSRELDHQWTSFGRVGALEYTRPGDKRPMRAMVQREGNSHAALQRIEHLENPFFGQLVADMDPERILVLLAGAGRDMLQFRNLFPEAHITGVELVPQMFYWPAENLPEYTAPILNDDKMEMVIAEGREFISRQKDDYDLILISYSGAGANYYTGAAAHSAGYLYTVEAFRDLIDHLAPNGRLIALNGNKGRLIRTIKHIWETDNRETPLEQSFIVVTDGRPYQKGVKGMSASWDPALMVIQPSGLSREQVNAINEHYTALYNPFAPRQLAYGIFLDNVALAKLEKQLKANFDPVWDDHPYFLNLAPFHSMWSPELWSESAQQPGERRLRAQIKLLGLFLLAAVVSTILPVLLFSRKRARNASSWSHMIYFLGIGLGFMLVEIGLLNKLQLIVGHPGYTLAVVLTSAILFTGVGSFCSDRLFDSGKLNYRSAALLACLFGIGMLALLTTAGGELMALPRPLKILAAALIPAPPFFLMGCLFPQGLRAVNAEDNGLVAWAFALNGVASAAGAGLAIILSHIYGYSLVIIAGLLVYLMVAMLPHQRRIQLRNS
ncbi:hypothetical protein [Cerasicoccus frondis]|uniref:hypothetical protein n=1 Tax=Cerasicoccus frondis TaxID=490090 RepID=UPI00285260E8|nr:hypothetical protein [Cerasicoccus frondis]